MSRLVLLSVLIGLALATAWARRCPDLSDHHLHVVPGTRCAICEWDGIKRRLGAG